MARSERISSAKLATTTSVIQRGSAVQILSSSSAYMPDEVSRQNKSEIVHNKYIKINIYVKVRLGLYTEGGVFIMITILFFNYTNN